MAGSSESFFTSPRERRLWLWALVAVVAIFSTLGLARSFVLELLDRKLLDNAFVLATFLIAVGVVIQGLRARFGVLEFGIMLAVGAAYFMVLLRMALPIERSHVIEYSVLGMIVYEALAERARHRSLPVAPAILAFLLTGLIGSLDEYIQLFLPSRVFDWRDILFNWLAALMAVCACSALAWGRRRVVRRFS